METNFVYVIGTNYVVVLSTHESWEQVYAHAYVFLYYGFPLGCLLWLLGAGKRWFFSASNVE